MSLTKDDLDAIDALIKENIEILIERNKPVIPWVPMYPPPITYPTYPPTYPRPIRFDPPWCVPTWSEGGSF